MTYKVLIMKPAKKRWLRKDRPACVYTFGESETLQGALILLEGAPFYIGEECVVVNESGSQHAIKRGRVKV